MVHSYGSHGRLWQWKLIATKSEFICELKKKITETSRLTTVRRTYKSRLVWLEACGRWNKLSRKVNRPTALFLS